ncbi:MAG: sensor histidine kinase [Nitriliruptor sp.]|nr:MAG: sensor histidine kinase [Nitriliruptor sp.]
MQLPTRAPTTEPPAGGASAAPLSEPGSIPGRVGWRRLSAGDGTYDRPPLSDVVVAAALGAGLLAELTYNVIQGTNAAFVPPVVGAVLAIVIAAPLAWRRVAPLVTIAVSGTATGAFTLLGHSLGLAGVTLMIALYSIAAYGTRRDAQISLGVTAGFLLAGYLSAWLRIGEPQVGPLIGTSLVLATVWALGDRTRARRQLVAQLEVRAEEAERHQALVTALATADERRRIARELHDVVAHAVSVVVVQASAGRRVAERDPDAALGVLDDIEGSGREALAELRRLVAVLREDGVAQDDGEPQPSLDEIAGLVDRLAEAGVPVRLERTGELREVPAGVGVSAYRIAQESLTNVLKHAGPVSEVVVRLEGSEHRLVVEVTDDGRGLQPPRAPIVGGRTEDGRAAASGASPRTTPGDGTGLMGLRERAAVLGGRLEAGARTEGGFRVRAELPLPVSSPVGRG